MNFVEYSKFKINLFFIYENILLNIKYVQQDMFSSNMLFLSTLLKFTTCSGLNMLDLEKSGKFLNFIE